MNHPFELVTEEIRQDGIFVTVHKVFMCEDQQDAETLVSTLTQQAEEFWKGVPQSVHISAVRIEENGD